MEKVSRFLIHNSLVGAILGFLFGVFVASSVSLGTKGLIVFLVISLVLFMIGLLQKEDSRRKTFLILSVCLLSFSFGVLRYEIYNLKNVNQDFISRIGTTITIESVIDSPPQDKGSYMQYVVPVGNGSQKILVKASPYPEFKYGEKVSFRGKLQVPKNFETDSGREFDYVSYLGKDHVSYILSFAQGTLISKGNGNPIVSRLYGLKNAFLENLNTNIVEPQASLMAGILLGVDTLGKEIEEKFRTTGIVHIVVLSGYNITIVAESLIRFFSFLPRSFALGTGAFGIMLFSIMVGGTPSVLRASCMALLVLLARATGRTYQISRALLIAAFIMVFWNPNILLFDVSFELSFLSTIALIWISPLFEKKLLWIPEKLGLRDVTSATLSTQLFVLPLLLYKMGQFSLVGLPVNLLVLGFVPTLMFFGFLTGLFGFISSWLAFPFAFISYLILTYILKVVDVFSILPFASFHITHFPLWLMWALYLFYAVLFWKFSNNVSKQKGASLA